MKRKTELDSPAPPVEAERGRLRHDERVAQILAAGGRLALTHGLQYVTRDAVAIEATTRGPIKCSMGTVSGYFSKKELISAIIREAIAQGHVEILADAIGMRHPEAYKAPQNLLDEAHRIQPTLPPRQKLK